MRGNKKVVGFDHFYVVSFAEEVVDCLGCLTDGPTSNILILLRSLFASLLKAGSAHIGVHSVRLQKIFLINVCPFFVICVEESVKAFRPACILTPSNSRGLEFGL